MRRSCAFMLIQLVAKATARNFDGYYRIKQEATGQYLDAYDFQAFPDRPGFEVVTRLEQHANVKDGVDKTQIWYVLENEWGSYSLMQFTSGRFADAVSDPTGPWTHRMAVVTRPANDSLFSTSQRWVLQHVSENATDERVRIMHAESELYLDARNNASYDFQVHLSLAANKSDPQVLWSMEKMNDSPVPILDGVFTITQASSGKNLDADEVGSNDQKDLGCYTHNISFNASQNFLIRRLKGEVYTIMQQSTGRFLGGEVPLGGTEAVIKPGLVDVEWSQQWMMVYMKFNTFVFQHVMTGRLMDAGSDGRVFGTYPSLASYDGNNTEETWTIKRIGFNPKINGVYKITNEKYETVLKISGGKLVAEKPDRKEFDASTFWDIVPIEGDIYEIASNSTHHILKDTGTLSLAEDVETVLDTMGALPPPPVAETLSFAQTETNPVKAAFIPAEQWYMKWVEGDIWYVMNSKTRKYLSVNRDGVLSMDDHGRASAQTWFIEKEQPNCFSKQRECPPIYECGFVDDWCGGNLTCGLSSPATTYKNGTCKGVNALTGQRYHCGQEKTCECTPKAQCSFNASCGTREDDGCGGYVSCGACLPPAPAPMPAPYLPVYSAGAPGAAPAPVFAAAPAPFAWKPLLPAPSTTMTTTCLTQCPSLGFQCGFLPDGCGGMLPCGKSKGLCPTHPVKGASFSCSAEHNCSCVARTTCDKGTECGFQDDGCGGFVACGKAAGNCTGGDNYNCKKNKCICTPDECGKRCGDPVNDGCGKMLQCKCTMANEVCDRKASKCRRVPGPTPDPKLFAKTTPPPAPAPAPAAAGKAPAAAGKKAKEAAKAKAAGAPAAADVAKAPAPQAAPLAPAPAPAPVLPPPAFAPAPAPQLMAVPPQPAGPMPPVGLTPGQPTPPPPQIPSNVASNLVDYYTYFYYVYFYYTYMAEKDKGALDAAALAKAQKMAPIYAYEQLQFEFQQAAPVQNMPGYMPQLPPGLIPMSPPHAAAAAPAAALIQSSRKSRASELWEKALAAAAAASPSSVAGLRRTDAIASRATATHGKSRQHRAALRGGMLEASDSTNR